jgi:hypothetical protein
MEQENQTNQVCQDIPKEITVGNLKLELNKNWKQIAWSKELRKNSQEFKKATRKKLLQLEIPEVLEIEETEKIENYENHENQGNF